jgi:phospholipase C
MNVRPSRRMQGILAGLSAVAVAGAALTSTTSPAAAAAPATATPIKHVVVIFQENVSFDHYFGTYPWATNNDGTYFQHMGPNPHANTLVANGLLTSNPNTYQPKRLGASQQLTCDMNHDYKPEQLGYDGGKMDAFVQNTETETCNPATLYRTPGLVMDYYDGNSVTALWNYANRFAMSDNSFSDVFGPSTPGAISLVSGQTHGFKTYANTATNSTEPATAALGTPNVDGSDVSAVDASGVGTIENDPQPAFDDCTTRNRVGDNNVVNGVTTPANIGDLLNAKGITWGFFQGGFKPTTAYAGAGTKAKCGAVHNVGDALGGTGAAPAGQTATAAQYGTKGDYIPHHEPFQYYASTANPHHLPPTSVAAIGTSDQANHQYDTSDFDDALAAGNLPAVSYLKAPGYQDGHAAYSDPIDEQHFITKEINAIEASPFWKDTAIVIAYDDSDGWADHVNAGVLNSSNDTWPTSTQQGDSPLCNTSTAPKLGGFDGRCGPGQRQPLLVISPYAKVNYVDHTLTTQSSILKFIEDNWLAGQRIGGGSFDATAGSLTGLFDFAHAPVTYPLWLHLDGSIDPAIGMPTSWLPTSLVGHTVKFTRFARGAMSVKLLASSLPPGLKFAPAGANAFTISGTPTDAATGYVQVEFTGPGFTQISYYHVASKF